MKEWFALHTRPYSERKVAVRLKRHDIKTYVPEAQSESERSNARAVPFFPGYMFIYVDMDKANPNHWRFTPGVRYIVSYGDEPIAVDEALIRTIREQLTTLQTRQRQPRARFKPGEQVRITDGPLKDMVAIFDGPSEPSERVQILLQIMSRYKRVRISVNDLTSASDKANSAQEKETQSAQRQRPRRTRGRGRVIRS